MPPIKPPARLTRDLLPHSAARILAKNTDPQVDQGPDACHLWKGKPDPKGYGSMNVGEAAAKAKGICKKQWAHRVAYALCVGDIPEGLTVDHTCRNPSCVNPKHLCLKTNAENAAQGNKDRKLPKGVPRGIAIFYEQGTMCPHCHSTAGSERRCLACGKVLPLSDDLNNMSD